MGKVFLVGAGPGDPDLITLKGIEMLKKCDVVIYDRLASYKLLEYTKKECTKIYVGKAAGEHSMKQGEINKVIVQCAKESDTVVRLKGGDSFVFGRGGEEIDELIKNNIDYQVIPGVTSAISVPESVGIPVTHRGVSQSFHVITGHTKASGSNILTDNYETLAKLDGTLVFLMGLSNLEQIVKNLLINGKDIKTPAAVISNGTMNNEKTVRGTLGDIVEKVNLEKIESPAIIVVGNTASLKFVSSVNKPLSNVNIGIVGTLVMREKLEKGLLDLGAKVFGICDMQIVETSQANELKEELTNVDTYRWILFTSQNAIRIFFDIMDREKIDRRKLYNIKFAVIGSGTSEALQKYGYYADFIPSKFTTKTLANEFSAVVKANEKVLIPRALRGSVELTEIFDKNNIKYNDIPIYDVNGELTKNIEYLSYLDCAIFVSASGAYAFFEGINKNNIKLIERTKIACIGEVTVDAVNKYNMNADIIANVSNTDGLIEAIANYKWN